MPVSTRKHIDLWLKEPDVLDDEMLTKLEARYDRILDGVMHDNKNEDFLIRVSEKLQVQEETESDVSDDAGDDSFINSAEIGDDEDDGEFSDEMTDN